MGGAAVTAASVSAGALRGRFGVDRAALPLRRDAAGMRHGPEHRQPRRSGGLDSLADLPGELRQVRVGGEHSPITISTIRVRGPARFDYTGNSIGLLSGSHLHLRRCGCRWVLHQRNRIFTLLRFVFNRSTSSTSAAAFDNTTASRPASTAAATSTPTSARW